MAENNVTTTGTVVFQDGDDLSEQNLTQRAAKSNQTDYVERGLSITADWAAGTIDIGSGYAVIQDGQQAYDIFPDAETDVSLPNSSGSNYVYLTHDPVTDDDVSIHVDDDDTPPSSTPALKLAVVDTSAESVTPLNTAPDLVAETLSTADLTVDDAVYYAGSDAELDDIQSVSSGDATVILGPVDFSDARTFDNRFKLIGTGVFASGTRLRASWTFNDSAIVKGLGFVDSGLTVAFNAVSSKMLGCESAGSTAIDINADDFVYSANSGGSVTFASGTSGGIVDSCSGTSVTDNSGSNTVGDIA